MKYMLILFILASCGKIKVSADPVKGNVVFGPDFQGAATFCDTRYGANTTASESCFEDYRTYFSPKVTLDFASISTFCSGAYTTQEDVSNCETNLLTIISNAAAKK